MQQKIFFHKVFPNLGPMQNKPMQLKRISEGAWGLCLKPLGDFCDFAAKIAILTPFQSHFSRL